MRLRKPGLGLSDKDRPVALAADLDNGKVEENGRGDMREVAATSHSVVHDERPYLNRPSEEFFTSAIHYPDELPQNPNPSLSSTPVHVRPPESLIGIAFGNPEVDPQPSDKPKVRQGHSLNAGSSLDASAAGHVMLAEDESRTGKGNQKGGNWASFAERFGIKNPAITQPSLHKAAQESPASSHWYSDSQEDWEKPPQYMLPETLYQYHPPPEWATSVSNLRTIEQKPRVGIAKKPSLLKNDKLLRKMSWRRISSRKSPTHLKTNHASENSRPWPLTSSLPSVEQAPTTNSIPQQKVPSSNFGGISLLRVDIPHIEMERYSVMFSHLLQTAEQPSLLARRQVNSPLARIRLATETRTKVRFLRIAYAPFLSRLIANCVSVIATVCASSTAHGILCS